MNFKKILFFLKQDSSEDLSTIYKLLGFLVVFIQMFLWIQSLWLLLIELIPKICEENNFFFDYLLTSFIIIIHIATFRSWYYAIKISSIAEDNLGIYKKCLEYDKNPSFDSKRTINEKVGKLCHLCKLTKYEGIHHCSLCNKCIIGMDHHCFFIAGCVGKLNYNFFLSYAFYACMNSLIEIVINHQNVINFIDFNFKNIHVSIWRFLTIYLISWIFFLFMGSLIFYHLFLILNEKTTIEDKYYKENQDVAYNYTFWKLLKICFSFELTEKKELYTTFKINWIRLFGLFSFRSICWPVIRY